MKAVTFEDIVKATGGKAVGTTDKKTIGVTMDSRLAGEGFCFVAIKGARTDGHDYIKDVFEKGAACVICDHVPEGVTGACVVVSDTVKALQDLARWYRSTLDVKVVGISGSVGKTSTKEMVASVLSAKFHVLKTSGNYNNEIGLPLTVLSIEEDHEIAVLEMGIEDFGEMRLLAGIAKPDICVLTNIGQSHLEKLGTRDGILRAKTEMFEFRDPNGPIFLNGDDDKLSTVKDVNGTKPMFFGFNDAFYSHPIKMDFKGLAGTDVTIDVNGKIIDAHISMIGKHNVANACVASAVGDYLGMTCDEIKKGLEAASTIAGRSNLIALKDGFLIDDCYNAAPTSMRAAIDTLCLASGRKVAILGDMFELGSDEEKMHYEIGEYAAERSIDKLVLIGKLAKNYYDGAKSKGGCAEMLYFATLDEALDNVATLMSHGDTVLLKASNGMKFATLKEKLLEKFGK
jgi:UDP-N-acetylmuramoyl-tripeptide--D-alanyl-D-alanine ligase